MNLSNNITLTDLLTFVLVFSTIAFYIYNIRRDNRKSNDLLQAKNYYFLSLMLQMHKKKLSSSFSKFVQMLTEEGSENFYLRLYTVIESRAIKNIAVDDLLKYYSEPVQNQGEADFKQVQQSWFYCFEYCQQWESSQEDAMQEQKDIDERGKVFYDDFMENYQLLNSELNTLSVDDFILGELYNQFYYTIQRHHDLISEIHKLPSMHSICIDYYKPIWESMSNIGSLRLDPVKKMLFNGQSIYGTYWSFIKGKITHFSREIENQREAELEFDKSITNLINYSIQHSNGKFKDMYKALAQQIKVKP